jgi:hypothetical protein
MRGLACAALVVGASFAGCAEPTQVTLVLSTNARCLSSSGMGDALVGIDIHHASVLDAKALASPNATTEACTAGADGASDVGTLVLVPGSKSAAFELLVVAGVRRPDGTTMTASECTELVASDKLASYVADHGKEAPCIVARRRLSFIESRRLTLPIELDTVCIGVVCGTDQTCSNGSCVNASVVCDSGLCGPGGGSGGAASVATSVTASVGSVTSSAEAAVSSVVSSVTAATSGSGGDTTTVSSSSGSSSTASTGASSVAASTGSGASVCLGPASTFTTELECMTGCGQYCTQYLCGSPSCQSSGAKWTCTCGETMCPPLTTVSNCLDCAAYCGSTCSPICADAGDASPCSCSGKGMN